MEKVKKPLFPAIFLLLHAYDQNADGLPDIESRARAKKAAQVYQRLVQQQGKKVGKVGLVVSYCGIRSGRRFVDTMADFLVSHGVARQDIIKAPFGQNTAGEIDSCIAFILRDYWPYVSFQRKDWRVVSVSSFYHLPRVWYLWFRRGWRPGVVGSFQAVHYGSVLKEVLKIGHSLVRPFASKMTVEKLSWARF